MPVSNEQTNVSSQVLRRLIFSGISFGRGRIVSPRNYSPRMNNVTLFSRTFIWIPFQASPTSAVLIRMKPF